MLRLRLTAGLRADGFAARFGFPLPARWRQRAARLPAALVTADAEGIPDPGGLPGFQRRHRSTAGRRITQKEAGGFSRAEIAEGLADVHRLYDAWRANTKA